VNPNDFEGECLDIIEPYSLPPLAFFCARGGSYLFDLFSPLLFFLELLPPGGWGTGAPEEPLLLGLFFFWGVSPVLPASVMAMVSYYYCGVTER